MRELADQKRKARTIHSIIHLVKAKPALTLQLSILFPFIYKKRALSEPSFFPGK